MHLGNLRGLCRRGGVHARRDGSAVLRAVRHPNAHLPEQLHVGNSERMPGRGGVRSRGDAGAALRKLQSRHAVANVRLDLPVGALGRLRERRVSARFNGSERLRRWSGQGVQTRLHVDPNLLRRAAQGLQRLHELLRRQLLSDDEHVWIQGWQHLQCPRGLLLDAVQERQVLPADELGHVLRRQLLLQRQVRKQRLLPVVRASGAVGVLASPAITREMAMDVRLEVKDDEVTGEFALALPPGMVAAKRDKAVDEALTEPLYEAARKLGVVLSSDANDYAHPLNGRDDQGRTRFQVRGRVQGDLLVPMRAGKRRR